MKKEGLNINSNEILKEMIENKESCRVIQEDSGYIVKLRPTVISESLTDKLSSEDVNTAMSITNRQIELSNIKTNLYRQCNNTNCQMKDKCIFRAIPNGNTNADVLFLNKMPTDYEVCNMSSHCDKTGTFLSLILNKMNVSRDSVYCTDIIKCNAKLDEQSFNECIRTYVENEINYVSPKVIICNGLCALKTCIKFNILRNLSEDVTYGRIYDAETSSGLSVKVMAMYDLNTVLQKTGADYEKCKTDLWTQILSAFKASM